MGSKPLKATLLCIKVKLLPMCSQVGCLQVLGLLFKEWKQKVPQVCKSIKDMLFKTELENRSEHTAGDTQGPCYCPGLLFRGVQRVLLLRAIVRVSLF